MKQIRYLQEYKWLDIVRFFQPLRENLFLRKVVTNSLGQRFYDPIGATCATTMAEGLFGYLMSPALDWFEIKSDKGDRDIQIWLEGCTKRIYETLRQSNFYSEIIGFLLDGITIGTGYLYFEDNPAEGTIYYKNISPGLCWISEDFRGNVNQIFRKDLYDADQIKERFGVKISTDKNFIIHAIMPNENKWDSVWMNENTGDLYLKGKYNYFPYIVWRCLPISHSPYGGSPSLLALPLVKTLNKIRKSLLECAELAVHPPLNVPIDADVDLSPDGFNYFSDPSQQITPVNVVGNFPVGEDREQAIKQEVKNFFNLDYFLMFASQPPSSRMTVMEVMERSGEKAIIMGNLIGRLLKVLDKIIEGALIIELQTGRIPPPPPVLDVNAEIRYLGPLAVAQQKLFQTKGVEELISGVAPIIQLNPQAGANLNYNFLVRYAAQASSAPPEALLPKEQVAAIQAAEAQQNAPS